MARSRSALDGGLDGAAAQPSEPASVLVGRDMELARLDAAMDRARCGRCVVVEMSGDPGMGKSSLLRAFAQRAGARYMSVLTARASRFEPSRPYGLFAEPIARADGLVYAHLDFGAGAQGVPERASPPGGAVAQFIAASADERGMLMCLDDLHWADDASLGVLRSLLRDPPGVPMVVACTYRPRQASALLVACLEDIADRCATERLELAPLDRAASDALLGPGIEAARRASLHQISGGNPLYLRILAALPDGPGGDRIARAAWAALLGELALVAPGHVEVLRAAALLGDPFDAALLPAAAGLDAQPAFGALDDLATADLVRPGLGDGTRYRFRHPLVRGLVLLQTPMSWRLAAHRRTAEALRAAGSGLAERAPHIAASARTGDVIAARELFAAAQRAAPTEPATAVAWLRTASRLLPAQVAAGQALRRDVLAALVRALAATGQWEACRTASAELLEAIGPEHGARRVGAIAFHALLERSLGDLPTARMVLEAELASARSAVTLPSFAVVSPAATLPVPEMQPSVTPAASTDPLRLGLARALLAQRQIAASRAALDAYTGPRFAAACTLALAAAYTGEIPELRRHTASGVAGMDAVTDGALADDLDSLAHLAWAEALGEHGEQAQRHFARGLRLGRRAARRLLTPYLLLGHAYSALINGNLRDAVRSAQLLAATDDSESSGHADLAGAALAVRAWAGVFLDGPDAAAPLAERALREIARYGRSRAAATAVLALIRFGQGRPAECMELVRSVSDRDTEHGPLRCVTPMLYSLASMASSMLGETSRAAAWTGRALADSARLGLPGQHAYALLANAVGTSDTRAAAEALADAAAGFADGGLVLAECQVRLLLAQKLVTLRRLDEAAAEVGRAKGRADACGARYVLRRAADVQRRIGAAGSRRSAPGAAATSPREEQIVRLVCLGKSNQEVAAELFLSAKTVEAHLTQVFRKLGVRSRAALIARAAADAQLIRDQEGT